MPGRRNLKLRWEIELDWVFDRPTVASVSVLLALLSGVSVAEPHIRSPIALCAIAAGCLPMALAAGRLARRRDSRRAPAIVSLIASAASYGFHGSTPLGATAVLLLVLLAVWECLHRLFPPEAPPCCPHCSSPAPPPSSVTGSRRAVSSSA